MLIVIVGTILRRFRGERPGSTDYWMRAGAATGILAIALQEIGEFSLQMPGNAVLFVVLLPVTIRACCRELGTAFAPREPTGNNQSIPLRIGFDMDGVLADFAAAYHGVEVGPFGPAASTRAGDPEDEPEDAPKRRPLNRRRAR